jgi:hypothetical protein
MEHWDGVTEYESCRKSTAKIILGNLKEKNGTEPLGICEGRSPRKMAKRLIEKLRLRVDELRELVNRNPHMPLGEVQQAVGEVEEIIMSLRGKELLKILDKKEVEKIGGKET